MLLLSLLYECQRWPHETNTKSNFIRTSMTILSLSYFHYHTHHTSSPYFITILHHHFRHHSLHHHTFYHHSLAYSPSSHVMVRSGWPVYTPHPHLQSSDKHLCTPNYHSSESETQPKATKHSITILQPNIQPNQ